MQKITHHPIFWTLLILLILFAAYSNTGLVIFLRTIIHAIGYALIHV